jgi:monofunctional biosynthetic peptidoglycan transglycosylase
MSGGAAPWRRALWRALVLLVLCTVSLQLFWVLRIALMRVVDPSSTAFQRSEIWRLLTEKHQVAWAQRWVDAERISAHLKRAVIASEDAGFIDHAGVEWDALEQAWSKNQRTLARPPSRRPPKLVGGSTITQQLAKNLFLSGERTLPRKAQELALTFALESLLPKRRILEVYLNHVEWGEGLFGAQAAARHYFRRDASQLDAASAARLAVMLPAPKRFERMPGSPYVAIRAATIVARMPAIELP